MSGKKEKKKKKKRKKKKKKKKKRNRTMISEVLCPGIFKTYRGIGHKVVSGGYQNPLSVFTDIKARR